MDRASVDTDQIIPKQFLKRIERTGFGQFLFFDWRFNQDGSNNPAFELNQPRRQGSQLFCWLAGISAAARAASMRVWAIDDYGFRVVIAPTFADIFYSNCFKNGVLPIALGDAAVEQLFQRVALHKPYELTVDLEQCVVTDAYGLRLPFQVDESRRHCLLHGLDDIGLTLAHDDKIAAYEAAHGIG